MATAFMEIFLSRGKYATDGTLFREIRTVYYPSLDDSVEKEGSEDMNDGSSCDWSGFARILHHLIGETVVVYVDDYSFFGRLADADTQVVTVAGRRGSSAGVHLTYIPFSKVQAVTEH